jgi:hypothetical protein
MRVEKGFLRLLLEFGLSCACDATALPHQSLSYVTN